MSPPPHDRVLFRALVDEARTDLLTWDAISDHAEESGLLDWLRTRRQRAPKPQRDRARRLLYRLDRDRRGVITLGCAPYEADKIREDLEALGAW